MSGITEPKPGEYTKLDRTSARRFSPENENIKLWLDMEPTDPSATKPITGKSYGGNSPNPTYIVKRLTAAFGPIGWGWGYREKKCEDVETDGGKTITNFITIEFWYFPFGRPHPKDSTEADPAKIPGYACFDQMGGTTFFYISSKNKPISDEDARKKSLTDAITKAASHIGFAGDIFTGRWDDSKYVEEQVERERRASSRIAFHEEDGRGEERFLSIEEWKDFWKRRLHSMASNPDYARLLALREANRLDIAEVAKINGDAAKWLETQLQRGLDKANAKAKEGGKDAPGPQPEPKVEGGDKKPEPDQAKGQSPVVDPIAVAQINLNAMINLTHLVEGGKPETAHNLLDEWLKRMELVEPARGTALWQDAEAAITEALNRSLDPDWGKLFQAGLRLTHAGAATWLEGMLQGKWKPTVERMGQEAPGTLDLMKRHVKWHGERAKLVPAPATAA